MIKPAGCSQKDLDVSYKIGFLKAKRWELHEPNDKQNPCFGKPLVWAFAPPAHLPIDDRLNLLAYAVTKQECVSKAYEKYNRWIFSRITTTTPTTSTYVPENKEPIESYIQRVTDAAQKAIGRQTND